MGSGDTKKPGGLRGSPGNRKYWSSLHETLADGRKRPGLSVQQATQQRLFLAVWEFGHCAPGWIPLDLCARVAPPSSNRAGAFLRFMHARPASLARMIDAAEVLSESMPFVRADFYDIAGRPIFGELTYYPDSGTARFEPPEYDRQVSAMWV